MGIEKSRKSYADIIATKRFHQDSVEEEKDEEDQDDI